MCCKGHIYFLLTTLETMSLIIGDGKRVDSSVVVGCKEESKLSCQRSLEEGMLSYDAVLICWKVLVGPEPFIIYVSKILQELLSPKEP